MRIGVVHWAFLPFIGGVESHLAAVYPEIVKLGDKVHLLTGPYPGSPAKGMFKGMVIERVRQLLPSAIKNWDSKRRTEEASRLFRGFIDKFQPDIVHAHNLHLNFPEYSKALIKACRSENIPVMLVLHNDYFKHNSKKITDKIVSLDWDKLVCISKYLRKVTLDVHRNAGSKCTVIAHGIDLDNYRPLPAGQKSKVKKRLGLSGKKVIFLPAKIIEKKGALQAVKAMKQVIKVFPDAVLVLKKTGSWITSKGATDRYVKKVLKQVHDGGLENNIQTIDKYLPLKQLSQYYAIADIVINPSVYIPEPFGLVPVEGMACGTPVIVTKSGGLVESVVDNQTGYIISGDPRKIPKELASRIVYLLKNGKKRERMGKAAVKRMRSLFDKKRMAKDLLELSRKLMHI